MKIQDKYINYLLTKQLDKIKRNIESLSQTIDIAQHELNSLEVQRINAKILLKKLNSYVGEEVRFDEGSIMPSDFLNDVEKFNESL